MSEYATFDLPLKDILHKINGQKEDGTSRCSVSYEQFVLPPIETIERDEYGQPIFPPAVQTYLYEEKAYVTLGYDSHIPDYLSLDIVFPTADCPEIRSMWSALKLFRKKLCDQPDKDNVFFIHLMEKNSEAQTPILVSIMNPLITYLTRDTPILTCNDELLSGEMVGGNIIRMIIPAALVMAEYMHKDPVPVSGQEQ